MSGRRFCGSCLFGLGSSEANLRILKAERQNEVGGVCVDMSTCVGSGMAPRGMHLVGSRGQL